MGKRLATRVGEQGKEQLGLLHNTPLLTMPVTVEPVAASALASMAFSELRLKCDIMAAATCLRVAWFKFNQNVHSSNGAATRGVPWQ